MSLPFKGIMYEMLSSIHSQGLVHGLSRKEPCADMEMNYVECLEAYGLSKGSMKCIKFMEDLAECKKAKLRWYRVKIMKEERYKKIAKGEIPFSERWGKPYDYSSYVYGSFIP